jgi:hypothetical protein
MRPRLREGGPPSEEAENATGFTFHQQAVTGKSPFLLRRNRPMTRRLKWQGTLWCAALLGLVLLAQDSLAQTVTVTNVQVGAFPPLGLGQQGSVSLNADASLTGVPSQSTDPTYTGPTWAWTVLSVQYQDQNGNWQNASPGEASVYTSQPDPTQAAATLYAAINSEPPSYNASQWQIEVQVTATYMGSGGAANVSGSATATDGVLLAKTFSFRPNGAIAILGTAATAKQPQTGTTPANGALVSPGQNVTFQLVLQDIDQVSTDGGMTWKNFGVDPTFGGAYSIQLTLTNATFTASGKNTLTQNATLAPRNAGVFVLRNVGITVDPKWNGAAPVNIAIQVTDNITIPAGIPLAPGGKATDCQDAVTNLQIQWNKATAFPTTLTVQSQVPDGTAGNIGKLMNTTSLVFMYLAGPKAPPAYQNDTVDEVFAARTSNLQTAWLTALIQATQPKWGDAQWQAYYFSGTGSANSSFYIGAANTFGDTHGGTIFQTSTNNLAPASLSAAGQAATIWVKLPQTYQCPPGTALANYTILRQWVGNGKGGGIFQMQKN